MKTEMKVSVLDKDCVYLRVYFCCLSCLSGVSWLNCRYLLLFCVFFSHRKSMISLVTTVTVTLKELFKVM